MEKLEELNIGMPSVFHVNDTSLGLRPCFTISSLYNADVVTSFTVFELSITSKPLLVK